MENTIQEVKFRLDFTKQADVQVTLENRVREKHMVMLPTTITHRGAARCPSGLGSDPDRPRAHGSFPRGTEATAEKPHTRAEGVCVALGGGTAGLPSATLPSPPLCCNHQLVLLQRK